MRRIGAWILMLVLFASMGPAWAEEEMAPMEPVYTFDLTVNGKHEVRVEPGDIITVVFTITRTDEDEEDGYLLYAMQNEIGYDESFVLPMENGCIAQPGIDTADIALRGYGRAFYMNYLSLTDGITWNDNQLVGTFQLQVNGESGVTELNNQNFCITKADGESVNEVVCNDLLLYVSDECTIRFETNGGSAMENAVVNYGELLVQPEDPIWEGHHLTGWYKDYDLTEPWDFENEPVSKNMVLYAAWADGEPKNQPEPAETQPAATAQPVQGKRVRIVFETEGGKPVEDLWVEADTAFEELPTPERAGYQFAGWYMDADHTEAWNGGTFTAKKTKLYAAWE